MGAQNNRLFAKITLIAFFVTFSFLVEGNSSSIAAADTSMVFDCSVWEGTFFKYRITEFETASGKNEAPVALGGGPKMFANSTPFSLGGHFLPVGRVTNPSWPNIGDWRNVIMLGEGYTLEVEIDTISPEEEVTIPAGELIPPLVTTDNEYGAGSKTNFLPTNPYSETTVFRPAGLTTLVFDDDHKKVTVPATEPWSGVVREYQTMLDFKLTSPLILPIKQYGNATFYETGDRAGERSSWIPVAVYEGIGYWTLSYRTNLETETPLGVTPSYEVGVVGHNLSTGIAESFEIVNRAMLAWMTNPMDPLVAFKIELAPGYPKRWRCPNTSTEPKPEPDGVEFPRELLPWASLILLAIGVVLLKLSSRYQ
ncbi:MAG: hypothetical protein ACFFB3_12535 [Candidatus Hodarchaeota archaeon]